MKINPAALGPRFALDLRNGPFSDPVDARTSTSGSWVMDAVIDRTRVRSDPPLCGVPIVRQRRINRLAKITVFFMLIPRMADQPPRVNISCGGDIVGHPRRQVEANRAGPPTLRCNPPSGIGHFMVKTLHSVREAEDQLCDIVEGYSFRERRRKASRAAARQKARRGWKDAKGRRNNGWSDTDAPAAYNRVVLRGV